jgi:hypothetical protein
VGFTARRPTMARPNAHFRRELLKHVPSTGGVPDYLLSTVTMLRAAFPTGVGINSPDYRALWSFLDHEQFTHRAVATALDFAFDLGYVDVLNAYAVIDDEALRAREIARVEGLLRPHGLERWRAEGAG